MQTMLYKNDWIGLRSLNEAGKVKLVNVSGTHLAMSDSDMKLHIVPYLKDRASTSSPTTTQTFEPNVVHSLRSTSYFKK